MSKIKYYISTEQDELNFPDSKNSIKIPQESEPSISDHDAAHHLQPKKNLSDQVTNDFFSIPINLFNQFFPKRFYSNKSKNTESYSSNDVEVECKPFDFELEGNILPESNQSAILIEFQGQSVSQQSNFIYESPNHEYNMKIFLQDSDKQSIGDFIFKAQTLFLEKSQHNLTFEYLLKDKTGNTSKHYLTLNTQHNHLQVHSPEMGYINEEGLLPGAIEASDYHGMVELDHKNQNIKTIQFSPLIMQKKLNSLNLTSQGIELKYELLEDNSEILASQGQNGPIVFRARIAQSGEYEFNLLNPIDMVDKKNLISDANFEGLYIENFEAKAENPDSSWSITSNNNQATVIQEIQTNELKDYQLTFYYNPTPKSQTLKNPIQVYWGEDHLISIKPSQGHHAYTFSVDGKSREGSKLKFICQNDEIINDYISNVSLHSRSQSNLPVLLGFMILTEQGDVLEGDFTVNVATTPPLEVNNAIPLDIMFEQNFYQTIIVNEDNKTTDPLTKINLESLFQRLTIPEENRHVEVVQREENGVKTNVYEVKISDKTESYDPITVADVQLSFPGGEAGLATFFKNIAIDDV